MNFKQNSPESTETHIFSTLKNRKFSPSMIRPRFAIAKKTLILDGHMKSGCSRSLSEDWGFSQLPCCQRQLSTSDHQLQHMSHGNTCDRQVHFDGVILERGLVSRHREFQSVHWARRDMSGDLHDRRCSRLTGGKGMVNNESHISLSLNTEQHAFHVVRKWSNNKRRA